jgi:putative endonuclease
MTSKAQKIGTRGEALAAEYLQQKGYQIIAQNWRCSLGELDIVAQFGDCLIFIEVKATRSADLENAFERLTPAKQKRLLRAIYAYLAAANLPDDTVWRVDAMALYLYGQPRIEYVENVFDW